MEELELLAEAEYLALPVLGLRRRNVTYEKCGVRVLSEAEVRIEKFDLALPVVERRR